MATARGLYTRARIYLERLLFDSSSMLCGLLQFRTINPAASCETNVSPFSLWAPLYLRHLGMPYIKTDSDTRGLLLSSPEVADFSTWYTHDVHTLPTFFCPVIHHLKVICTGVPNRIEMMERYYSWERTNFDEKVRVRGVTFFEMSTPSLLFSGSISVYL